MTKIDEMGVWSLPNNPNRELPGRLISSLGRNPRLDLLGQLQEIDLTQKLPNKLDFDIINGTLIDGRLITLCCCFQPLRLKTGIPTSTVYSEYFVVGHHFQSLDEIMLQGVSIKIFRFGRLGEFIKH